MGRRVVIRANLVASTAMALAAVAARYPEKSKEMKALFLAEARKYEVLPLGASVATRLPQPRPNLTEGRGEFVYTRPMTGLPQGDSPLPREPLGPKLRSGVGLSERR